LQSRIHEKCPHTPTVNPRIPKTLSSPLSQRLLHTRRTLRSSVSLYLFPTTLKENQTTQCFTLLHKASALDIEREREEHTLQQTSKLVPQLLVQNSFLKKKTKNNRKGGPKTSTGQTDYRAAEIAINQTKWTQRVQQSSLDVFLLTCTNQLQTERTLVLLKQSSKQEQKQL